jgi:rare lipoprotein A
MNKNMCNKLILCCLSIILAYGCGTPKKHPPLKGTLKPYKVFGKKYYPLQDAYNFTQSGIASWYGKKFHGRKTANGEIYDMYAMTAAHKTLPLGTYVRVVNKDNNKEIVVRVNDRGPFVSGRIIDLSYTAAKKLGMDVSGTAKVRIIALGSRSKPNKKIQTPGSFTPANYSKGNFTIQVGAFKDRKNAQNLLNKLAKKYKNAHMATDLNDVGTYKVRVGKCSTLQEAAEYKEILLKDGMRNVFTIAE